MSYSEMDIDILLLAANGNERQAKERLRAMTPAELRELRDAIATLDDWLDAVILERHTQASQRRTKP